MDVIENFFYSCKKTNKKTKTNLHLKKKISILLIWIDMKMGDQKHGGRGIHIFEKIKYDFSNFLIYI